MDWQLLKFSEIDQEQVDLRSDPEPPDKTAKFIDQLSKTKLLDFDHFAYSCQTF